MIKDLKRSVWTAWPHNDRIMRNAQLVIVDVWQLRHPVFNYQILSNTVILNLMGQKSTDFVN